jgi:hypothetical protein
MLVYSVSLPSSVLPLNQTLDGVDILLVCDGAQLPRDLSIEDAAKIFSASEHRNYEQEFERGNPKTNQKRA